MHNIFGSRRSYNTSLSRHIEYRTLFFQIKNFFRYTVQHSYNKATINAASPLMGNLFVMQQRFLCIYIELNVQSSLDNLNKKPQK